MSHSSQRRIAARRSAFTLIELLVVIGIIAVLISVLLPTLAGARKSADKTKCLAALHQIGDAYKMYQVDNKGAWPVANHFYPRAPGPAGITQRDKRYHDFIAKYVMGTQQVSKNGQSYSTNEMNFNGTVGYELTVGNYATWGEFGSVEDPVWIGTLRTRNSVLWGCPSWNRIGSNGTQYEFGSNNGYTMNIFPQAPDDLLAGAPPISMSGINPAKVAHIIEPNAGNGSTPVAGRYFKMTGWKAAADRALLFDGVHNAGYFNSTAWNTGTPVTDLNVPSSGVVFDPTDPGALLPPQSNSYYPLDWNRHTKSKVGKVKNSDLALNVLFCDGHAATLSTREAYKAIRFK